MPYLHSMGDFSDQTQCSEIPLGNPYRKPGNYCATPDGGNTTFNADGTTYRAPGAVDPDPAHPAAQSTLNTFLSWLTPAPMPPVAAPMPVSTGMSTTTKLMLAGGALMMIALIARR